MNTFEYVILAAARARQLQARCIPTVQGSDKKARLAMKEIREQTIERLPLERVED